MAMSTCHCIIWHPETNEEREVQLKRYEHAAIHGNTAIAMMYLASLFNKCETRKVSDEQVVHDASE